MSKKPSVAKAERDPRIREDYKRMFYEKKMRVTEIYKVLAKENDLAIETIRDICTRS